jgi:C4-dicarboxylate-specific signal transduction histidine kinase
VVLLSPFTVEPGLMAALTAILVLSILGGGLLVEHRRRRRAELDARRYLATLAHMDRRAAMGELAASLAHELNQPLGAILRNAEAAKMLLSSGTPQLQELREIVEDIRKDDKRAGELIRRMRTLLGRRELETQLVELKAVARDTIELVAPEAAAKGVRVDVEESIDSTVVVGDRVYLQQVLLNLVLNGMDAMADMPADRRRLIVRTVRNNGHVDVSVKDTGPGIAVAALPYVFEPFFTTKPEGMGMGLSIARRIVQAHDGRIVAENNGEGGATVRFSVPVGAQKKEDAHDARHLS